VTTKPIRFGVIGTGRIGQVHAANIVADPDAVLSWVADPFVEGAKKLADRYGACATDSAEDIFASGNVDAVLIASPTPTHVDLIERAVDAGIPVLCEKPVDLDINRVDQLRPKIAASNVPVAIGFNRRFDPAFASVRRRVAQGEIGELEQLAIISRDPSAPPASYIAVSGGIFRDMTIHDFDMARFFVPDIVEVTAVGTTTFDQGAQDNGDFDTASVTMRASSGTIVTVTNSRHSAVGYDQRLEAFGAEGMLQVANMPQDLVSLSTGKAVETKLPYQTFFLERYAVAYAAELHEFVKLVAGEPSTVPTFEDGRAALLLANAAQESASTHTVVPVEIG
jgi:myo-inositol 2-dehydrogenase/D-chiro-inositol 1-dehydrogenase